MISAQQKPEPAPVIARSGATKQSRRPQEKTRLPRSLQSLAMTNEENEWESRYAPMLKLVNELGQRQLLESKRRRREAAKRQWTLEKRAHQSQIISDNKPWLKSTGPKTPKGIIKSSQNALRHGFYSDDCKEIRKLLKIQRNYLKRVRKATYENIRDLELEYARNLPMSAETTTIDQKAKQLKRLLSESGVSVVHLRDIKDMIKAVTGHREEDFITKPETPITKEQEKEIDNIAARYEAGEPLTRILGCREFWGLEFKVTPDVLDPRPDTETLIEAALKWARQHPKNQPSADRPRTCAHGDFKILDLGTGTGCIPIALLSELPDATAVAVDISPKAIEVACENAAKHKMTDRLTIQEGDWMTGLDLSQFDLIVSNPPYIAESVIGQLDKNVKNHDPHLALSGGNDGLDCYKKIIYTLKTELNEGSRAFLEIGFDQLESLAGLVEESGLCLCDSYRDIGGNPRVVEISSGDK